MDLQDLRQEIDRIDEQLLELFRQRMDITASVARYKLEHNLPIYDPARERQKLAGHEAPAARMLALLFELSRAAQEKILHAEEGP